jgi:Mn2+/Fe2+ NRAMP family transporter
MIKNIPLLVFLIIFVIYAIYILFFWKDPAIQRYLEKTEENKNGKM